MASQFIAIRPPALQSQIHCVTLPLQSTHTETDTHTADTHFTLCGGFKGHRTQFDTMEIFQVTETKILYGQR